MVGSAGRGVPVRRACATLVVLCYLGREGGFHVGFLFVEIDRSMCLSIDALDVALVGNRLVSGQR